MNHPEVARRIAVERKVLNLMEGGCQLPLGVYYDDNDIVYVSHSVDWTQGSAWYEYDAEDLDGLAEYIVEDITVGFSDEEE